MFLKEGITARKRGCFTDPIKSGAPSRGEKTLPTASTSMGSPTGVPVPKIFSASVTFHKVMRSSLTMALDVIGPGNI
jgi:hypothetical protein